MSRDAQKEPDPPLVPTSSSRVFVERRRRLATAFDGPALFFAGLSQSRNFRANVYPFRASSHFLYLMGAPLEGSALLVDGEKSVLYTQPPDPEDALWHGPRADFAELKVRFAVDAVRDVAELSDDGSKLNATTLPPADPASAAWLTRALGHSVEAGTADRLSSTAAKLADAMVGLRSAHDDAGVAQLRFAGRVTAEAHLAGMRATTAGGTEHQVKAAMVGVLRAHALEDAYQPIVSVHGEVLHCMTYENRLAAGDLLLADVGGETPEGWAADITRTWPVSGTFSPTQRAIYDVVLDAQRRAIAKVGPGVSYREVHEEAKRAIIKGLVALSIFRGEVDGLLERGAAALFFPHGVGHLLGLDVHDMEDLGDRAGYAPGRKRSSKFGDAFLRLDRDLEPGMAVTIEPGFYQVPGILNDPKYTAAVGADLNRNELAKYADVRGIRIEDDVLVTHSGREVLTSGVPTDATAIEAVMAG